MKSKILLFCIVLICLSGCEVFDAAVARAVEQTQTEKEAAAPKVTNPSPSPTKTTSYNPNSPKTNSPTQDQFTSASSVTINQKGKNLEVYGRITFVGEEQCPDCPNGYYSYLVLDKVFYIISYDWVFYSDWIGDCIMVKDTVEPFGSKPSFVFGAREGYDGSKCEYLQDGTLSCSEGDYFKSYFGCRN